jgi:hypothetical protein
VDVTAAGAAAVEPKQRRKEAAVAEEAKAREGKADEYEYDLAHDEATVRPAAPPAAPPRLPPDMHVIGEGGDYGHDLAHDMG